MRAALIDNDKVFCDRFSACLTEWGKEYGLDMEVICVSPEKISNALGGNREERLRIGNRFDAFFIEVHMSDQNGMELLRELRSVFPKAIYVLMSEDTSCMPEAFIYQPSAFFRKKNLEEDVRRWMGFWSDEISSRKDASIPCDSGGDWRMNPEKFAYCMSVEHYVRFEGVDGGGRISVLKRVKLDTVEEVLRSRDFVRIHRRYLVNRCFIKEIRGHEAVLTLTDADGKEVRLPVSHWREAMLRENIYLKENTRL